jgi:hypothetical protein
MKRAIRWAVDNGFEQVAWTTGEQQRERYDLAERIRQIDDVVRAMLARATLRGVFRRQPSNRHRQSRSVASSFEYPVPESHEAR